MASFLPPVVFEIKALANEAIAKFEDVNKELDKMGDTADKAGGKVSGIDKASKIATAGLLALGTAFVGFAALGIKEAMQAEQVMAQLGQTMSNAGVNTAENRKMVEELAQSYIQLGFADEDAAGAFNVLLRATGDVTQAQNLMSISADYARVKHISMADAAAVMAKAGQGSVKAFKEMGISLDSTLPKSQAIAKAMDELKDKIGGQAQAYTKTFAGQMAVMKAQFEETAQTLGNYLIPILTQFLTGIRNGIKFVQDHATAFKIFGGIILTAAVALASYNAYVKISTAMTKAWAAISAVQATVTAMLTGEQVALNTAMTLNPIGLVVAAVVALIAVFVVLWNKFEGFRKAVITVAKIAINAFASIIPMLGQVGEAYLKFLLTPMILFLSALSHLPGVGKYAKAGLDLLTKGLDGVSDFADKTAAKAKNLAANLDKLNKPIKITFTKGGGIPETPNGAGGTGTGGKGGGNGLTAEQKKANDGYMKIVKDLQEKTTKATTKFNESMLKAQTEYNEKVAELNKEASDKIAELNTKAAEERLSAKKDYDKKVADAQSRFNDEMGNLNKNKIEDLTKAEIDHYAKLADITMQGNQKLADIVQQSVDRLRNAFIKGTEINASDLFKGLGDAGARKADDLLKVLKDKFSAAKNLAVNAAKLQAMGFSQTFIEQVVAAGPEVGNEMAQALQDASPDTIKELQDTFVGLESVTNHGLDQLATAMSKGGKLATDELNQAYLQAQKDMANFLAQEQSAYTAKQAEINAKFSADMAAAEKTRDNALADAKAAYDEHLAAIDKDLADSIAKVNKDLADGLAKASKDLADAQAAARKQLTDDLAAIQKEFDDKLGNIKGAIASTIAAIASLKAAMANAQAGAITTPVITPATTGNYIPYGSAGSVKPGDKGFIGPVINTTVNATTNANPSAIATAVTNAANYGTTVNTTTLAGIMAASGTTSSGNQTAQGYANKIKAMGLNAL